MFRKRKISLIKKNIFLYENEVLLCYSCAYDKLPNNVCVATIHIPFSTFNLSVITIHLFYICYKYVFFTHLKYICLKCSCLLL